MKIRRIAVTSALATILAPHCAFAQERLDPLPPAAPTYGPPIVTTTTPAPAAPPSRPASSPTQSVKLSFESTQSGADRGASQPAQREPSPDDSKLLHGFRLGYAYVMSYDRPLETLDGQSLKQKLQLKAPSHFLIGYELVYRVVGQSWLNVLLIGNGMVAGLEQGKILPTGNLLLGAEINNSFQLGVGASLAPLRGQEAHTILAAGWTPRVGTLYTPVHVFFVPDAEGAHRIGATTGVTF